MIDESAPVFRLCYVEEPWAWFTTQAVEAQWGDDWNDAPYEHNAGTPYVWREGSDSPPYSLVRLAYEGAVHTPEMPYRWGNSPYSVQMINQGAIPWLEPEEWDGHTVRLYAGVTIDEFKGAIRSIGGGIWEPAW